MYQELPLARLGFAIKTLEDLRSENDVLEALQAADSLEALLDKVRGKWFWKSDEILTEILAAFAEYGVDPFDEVFNINAETRGRRVYFSN